MNWSAQVTVAAIIEQNGRFLMVEENIQDKTVINQPAGHLEDKEALVDAVIRETREETAWLFKPEGIVGIYRWRTNEPCRTFLRVAFCGSASDFNADQELDDDIIRTVWLSLNELESQPSEMRSPLVIQTIRDYQRNQHYSLDLLVDMD